MPTPPLNVPRAAKFVLTSNDSIWVVTGAGAYKINPVTGEIVKWIREHPILYRDLSVFEATTEVLAQTEGVRGAEELRLQAGKFLATLVKKMEAEVAQTTKRVADLPRYRAETAKYLPPLFVPSRAKCM